MGEQHGNFVTIPRISRAGHNHTREIDLFGQTGALQSNGHFGPGGEWFMVAKLNAVFPDTHRIGGYGQTLSGVWRQSERTIFDFSGAHTWEKHITVYPAVNHPF